MAPKRRFLLLLWGLTLFVHGVSSLCNVTCSTDYNVSLNCSCSGWAPTHSVPLEVKCRDGELEVTGSCEVKPPESWCVMYPEMLYEIASIGTTCTGTVARQGDQEIMHASESSSWDLSDVVKPLPPVDVQVTNSDGFYNITWDKDQMNQDDCLIYSVRVRNSKDLSKEPAHSLSVHEKYFLLDHNKLHLHVNYTVDIKAKMCGIIYNGPWSEWSSPAEWRTIRAPAETEGINGFWWYAGLPVIPVLALLWLGYSKKLYWQKKIQLITFIPTPSEFFKPLYQNNGGDFKEWVKPVFSEHDYVRISPQIQPTSEKRHSVLEWKNEKQSYSGDNEMKQAGHFLHMLQPHSSSLLLFQDGASSQGTSHSAGHIFIHTVTLSGEEEFEAEVALQGSFEEDNRQQAGFDLEEPQISRLERQSGILPHQENQISNDISAENIIFQPHAQPNEPERVSLDSFASHEQSEDGYPHVDLDTIDSGFGECSSPGASDSNIAEQIDSDLYRGHKISNSNYVKQWMISSTIQEDSSNSENDLHETQ
ncbi:interleukin-21 receptor-like [Pempheris klunzingeri]|uniref:interleukin-21 receptor-like n=1 Tax=Pempheris klunzingeri TaxID=3127111 RepID=UPI00397EAA52